MTITAHRALLAAFANYFAKLFTVEMKECTRNEVELKCVDGTALSKIIDFAYTGKIEITQHNVIFLLETANYIGVTAICKACCDLLAARLNIDNVIDILIVASTYGCKELDDEVTKCLGFGHQHFCWLCMYLFDVMTDAIF